MLPGIFLLILFSFGAFVTKTNSEECPTTPEIPCKVEKCTPPKEKHTWAIFDESEIGKGIDIHVAPIKTCKLANGWTKYFFPDNTKNEVPRVFNTASPKEDSDVLTINCPNPKDFRLRTEAELLFEVEGNTNSDYRVKLHSHCIRVIGCHLFVRMVRTSDAFFVSHTKGPHTPVRQKASSWAAQDKKFAYAIMADPRNPRHNAYWYARKFTCKGLERLKQPETCQPSSAGCPATWFSFGNHCYKAHGPPRGGFNGWTARQHCLRQGSDQVSIHSNEEQAFVRSLIAPHRFRAYYWIGMRFDRNFFGAITRAYWTDGSAVNYAGPHTRRYPWAAGEPNNRALFQSEKCIHIYGNWVGWPLGAWNDLPCELAYAKFINAHAGTICKKKKKACANVTPSPSEGTTGKPIPPEEETTTTQSGKTFKPEENENWKLVNGVWVIIIRLDEGATIEEQEAYCKSLSSAAKFSYEKVGENLVVGKCYEDDSYVKPSIEKPGEKWITYDGGYVLVIIFPGDDTSGGVPNDQAEEECKASGGKIVKKKAAEDSFLAKLFGITGSQLIAVCKKGENVVENVGPGKGWVPVNGIWIITINPGADDDTGTTVVLAEQQCKEFKGIFASQQIGNRIVAKCAEGGNVGEVGTVVVPKPSDKWLELNNGDFFIVIMTPGGGDDSSGGLALAEAEKQCKASGGQLIKKKAAELESGLAQAFGVAENQVLAQCKHDVGASVAPEGGDDSKNDGKDGGNKDYEAVEFISGSK